jgi:hypothetical protein
LRKKRFLVHQLHRRFTATLIAGGLRGKKMNIRGASSKTAASKLNDFQAAAAKERKSNGSPVLIRVSGKLSKGHLSYLDQLVESATDCQLWPVLSLAQLEELDEAALQYLLNGEDRDFGIVSCPNLIRESIELERARTAA